MGLAPPPSSVLWGVGHIHAATREAPMSAKLPSSLVLVGAGKMGQAMLEGWLKLGLDPASVTAIDPHLILMPMPARASNASGCGSFPLRTALCRPRL